MPVTWLEEFIAQARLALLASKIMSREGQKQGEKMDKFYILTNRQNDANKDAHQSKRYGRSKIFDTREEAEETAKAWLREGTGTRYYIMESESAIQKTPEFETIEMN